jgi:hypothetical protein
MMETNLCVLTAGIVIFLTVGSCILVERQKLEEEKLAWQKETTAEIIDITNYLIGRE